MPILILFQDLGGTPPTDGAFLMEGVGAIAFVGAAEASSSFSANGSGQFLAIGASEQAAVLVAAGVGSASFFASVPNTGAGHRTRTRTRTR